MISMDLDLEISEKTFLWQLVFYINRRVVINYNIFIFLLNCNVKGHGDILGCVQDLTGCILYVTECRDSILFAL